MKLGSWEKFVFTFEQKQAQKIVTLTNLSTFKYFFIQFGSL